VAQVPPPLLDLRSGRACPGCRSGESAIVVEAEVAAGAPPPEGSCAATDRDAAAREFLAPPAAAGAARLGPAGACRTLGAVLPRGSRYVGYRYEAEDLRTSGDCLASQPCPVGDSLWHGHPAIVQEAGTTAVAAVFENRAAAPRRARLWIYFTSGR
jgi:hypothetical protein